MSEELLPYREIPQAILQGASKRINDCSIGFVQVTEGRQRQEARLSGSGTLVSVGRKRAILTAHHVIEVLPRSGRLGLILSQQLQQYSIDTKGAYYMPIARGSDDSQGPDLAAVILSEAIAGTIAAQKTFYSLDRHREHMLSKPVEPDLGIWAVHGFVNERTVEQPGESGFTHIMRFGCLTGYGGSHQPVTRGEYDYHDFPVTYGVGSVAPINFQGMSGGGLWQVRLQRDAQGNLGQAPLLRGSVFYQRSKTETETSVVCHGTASLYRIAYEAIRDAKS